MACEVTAETAVKLFEKYLLGKDAQLLRINVLQEDAAYEVVYTRADDVYEIARLKRVVVSTSGEQCRLDGIE